MSHAGCLALTDILKLHTAASGLTSGLHTAAGSEGGGVVFGRLPPQVFRLYLKNGLTWGS